MAFVPLFCMSSYSPAGVSSVADLARRARGLGYATLGLCDEATIAGFHEFDQACGAQGLRPIFGCRLQVQGFVEKASVYPLDFLIQSDQGYRNLVRMLTRYHDRQSPDRGRLSAARLRSATAGLKVVIPPDGELAQLIQRRDRTGVQQFLVVARKVLGPELAIGLDAQNEQHEDAPMLRQLARFIAVEPVAAPRIRYAHPADAPAAVYLDHPERPPGRGWKPPDDVRQLPALLAESIYLNCFQEDDDASHESGEIARRCAWRPSANRRIIPTEDFERGFDANSYLFDLVVRGAAERYGEIDEALKKRIHQEFEEVQSREMAPFLLFYRRITKFLDDHGVSRGVGRGAVVASVLAYCLGITRLDPLRYRLVAQPLAGPDEKFPAIRIEIPAAGAPELIAWLTQNIGEPCIARIGRRSEPTRAQILESLAAWSGMTEEELELAKKEISRRRKGGDASKLLEQVAEKRWKRWRDPAFMADVALRLSRRPKPPTASPSGWTLISEPLEYVIPTIRDEDGQRITDIGSDGIDRLGAPRLELAPHHLLNLLDRSRLATAQSEPGLDLMNIPMGDRATLDLLGRGDTDGIPPLEPISVKCLLRRDRPGNIIQLLKVKTEAGRGRTIEKPMELIEALPDVLLSYQCAYLKANHPKAFYAGALFAVSEVGRPVTGLIRAAQRAGIEVLPPDINLSSDASTVQGGKIRLGLKMVKRLGAKAWDEIHTVRRGGRFNSLAEWCERVSTRTVNHGLMQNLIGAGVFDSFGQSRAEMSKLVTRFLAKIRSSAHAGASAADDQYTLFDGSQIDVEDEADQETPGHIQEWDQATRIQREFDALGFNLDADPLEPRRAALASLKPIMPHEVTGRMNGRVVRVAGLIDHVDGEGPLIDEPGAKLVDLEGLAVWLGPDLARICDSTLEGAVLVIGCVNTSHGYTRVDAQGLWSLDAIENQARRVDRIRLDLSGENRATLKRLTTLAKAYRGASKLEPSGYTAPRGLSHRALARQRVFFCSPFYQGLCKILPVERVEIFDQEGQALAIALTDGGDSDPISN